MDEREYYYLLEDSSKIMEGLCDLIRDHKNNDKYLYELKGYVEDIKRNGFAWNMKKAQIILMILQSKNSDEILEITSYLEQSNYGWQGEEYKLYSRCAHRCRENYFINTPETTEKVFFDIDKIFLHEKYGSITTYLFGYCLASLFSSRLKERGLSIPYFLQIACKRSSNVYRLVHEIVNICDANTGVFEECDKYDYRECDHNHLTIYPSETGDKLLDTLIYYRDIPIIVDGYENEKLYEIFIREVANIPSKIKRLDIKAKFNILPIFITPVLQSQFQNVFSMDFTELDIEDEYIEVILKNKQRLGSWALELLENAKDYFDVWNSTAYSQDDVYAKLLEKRHPKEGDRMPLFYDLSEYLGGLRTKYNRSRLTSKDMLNIGYLSYFFSKYMKKAFKHSIRLSQETVFTYRGRYDKHRPAELIDQIVEQATDSLFQLHTICSPAMPETINMDIDSADEKKAKRIEKKGATFAKDIVKYYQSYKVNIRISDIKYKDERYIFSVKLLPGTDEKLLGRYAEEVRRLLELKFFFPDITSSSINLIASEKPLKENSLIKILESQQFKESKMDIPYAVGYDVLGEMVIADVTEFPHLLIGGANKSGKSSAIHSLLMSIVYKQPANKVKLLLMDFGASRLKMFKDVPHMLMPGRVINDIREGRQCILKLQGIMEDRLKTLDSLHVKDYDKQLKRWPSIICVIDEFPAFISQLTEGKGNKDSYMIIGDLLNRARKIKVHLVLAAQDTTKDSIRIKNTNLTAGIAFRCENWQTSKVIIGETDAVRLSGKGSMYFKCDQCGGLIRLQGSFMSPDEIIDRLDTMNFMPDDEGETYDEVMFESLPSLKSNVSEQSIKNLTGEDPLEELLCRTVELAINEGELSNKMIMNEFGMGYIRADKYLKPLEDAGIITKQKGKDKKRRSVNLDKAKEFLRDRGYSGDASEGELTKTVEISSIQNELELIQERNTEETVEILDVPEEDDSFVDNSPQRQRKKIKPKIPPQKC